MLTLWFCLRLDRPSDYAKHTGQGATIKAGHKSETIALLTRYNTIIILLSDLLTKTPLPSAIRLYYFRIVPVVPKGIVFIYLF